MGPASQPGRQPELAQPGPGRGRPGKDQAGLELEMLMLSYELPRLQVQSQPSGGYLLESSRYPVDIW